LFHCHGRFGAKKGKIKLRCSGCADVGAPVRADTRNIETLTGSQPANADADSAPNWLPEGLKVSALVHDRDILPSPQFFGRLLCRLYTPLRDFKRQFVVNPSTSSRWKF
jgi:hypothetical protein